MIGLIRLYPSRWRERYGGELEQLVLDVRPEASRWRIAVDLVKGALVAHFHQGLDMQVSDRRAIGRGALIGAVVGLVLAVGILLSNVVFPTTSDDDTIPVLASYLLVFAAMFVVGWLAARDGAGPRGYILAGAVVGIVIGTLTIVTFVVVDNVWLDIVSKQPQKIDGFARSGAASMRDYINHDLIGPAVYFIVGFGLLGVILSSFGGAFGRPSAPPSSVAK